VAETPLLSHGSSQPESTQQVETPLCSVLLRRLRFVLGLSGTCSCFKQYCPTL